MKIFIEDLRAHREGIWAQGFWAITLYRFAHLRLKCRIPVVRQMWYVANRIICKWTEVTTGIMLPETVTLGRRVQIEHFGGIIIHGQTVIGDDCIIRQGVTIGNNSRQPDFAPHVGNRVEIGAGAKIIGPITIGSDVAIGANAVVITDVPDNCIAVGVPATIKRRQVELCSK